MKVDLKGLQKVGGNDQMSILRHPKGHVIKVAHSALSEKMKKDLEGVPHFQAGGMVEEDPENYADEIGKNIIPMSAPPAQAPNLQFMDAVAQKHEAQAEPALALEKEPEVQAPIAQAPASTPSPAAQTSEPQVSAQGADVFLKGLSQEKKGISQEADAQAAQAKATAAAEIETQQRLQSVQENYQKSLAELQSERQALQADLQNAHIDPSRFINNMSTGKKIGTAIGLMLSGLGAGGSGQQNMAEKFLRSQIDADIEAQKGEIGKKQNLLSMNMQKFGDLRAATEMTKAMQLDIAASKLRQSAEQTKEPIVRARALQAAGKLDRESAEMIDKLAKTRAMNMQLRSGQIRPEQMIHSKIQDESERKLAREEYAGVEKLKTSARNVNDLYDQIKDVGAIGANLPFSGSRAKMGTVRAQLTAAVKDLSKEKFTDQDEKSQIWPLLPEGSDTPEQLQIKKQGLINLMKSKMGGTPTLSAYGINVDSGVSDLTSKQERLLNFAKANPNDPKSKAILERLGKK